VNRLDYFEFSQSSLQDFVDCPRRFQLRYLQHVSWPAIQAEPARENEQHIQRGERFHRLAQQYLLGIAEERLTRIAEADSDENLTIWWRNFLSCVPESLSGERHVETALMTTLGSFRLVAKFDLVLIGKNGQAVIYDWKTSPRKPKRQTLLNRMQTRVYPFLLTQSGAALNHGKPLLPEQIQMIYWFAEPDQGPEVFPYSETRCQEDEQILLATMRDICARESDQFPVSANERSCQYCVYRSLCNRGGAASDLFKDETGDYDPQPSETLDFDLEQINEIQF
jgi:CRISPR/Cas system-associated exonuclease Cas4 (RecB family)